MPDRPVAPVAVRRVEVPDWLPPADGEPDRQARPGHDGPMPCTRPQAAGRPDDPGARPDLGSWPFQFAQVLAETLAGSRPVQQLTPWTTGQTRQRIRELGLMLATGQRPRVRRIMASAPAADVLEMTAVVGFGPRVRVLALRLERAGPAGAGWQCTALESA